MRMVIVMKGIGRIITWNRTRVNIPTAMVPNILVGTLQCDQIRMGLSRSFPISIVGAWKNDYKHGKGTFKYANGDVYEGMFEKGLRSGPGTYKFHGGPKIAGHYKNDVRLKDSVSSNAQPATTTTTTQAYDQDDEESSTEVRTAATN